MAFTFYDPIISKRRGDAQEPLNHIEGEPKKIINSKILLSEIPDKNHSVVLKAIPPDIDEWIEIKNGEPVGTQFKVDFLRGELLFDSSQNGKVVKCDYWGSGCHFIPASMIYTQYTSRDNYNYDIAQTLKDLIDNADSLLDLDNLFISKGEYTPDVIYYPRNIVKYNNSSYICIVESENHVPTDTNYWHSLVDGLGINAKLSVKVATTENINLSETSVIDDINLTMNDRVLVKNQTNAIENGIYLVGSNSLQRADDANVWTDLISAYVFIEKGTVNADTGWLCTVDYGGILEETNVTWVQFSGAGTIDGVNIGSSGAGVFKQKNGTNLEFRKISANSDKVSVINDEVNDTINIDINEDNFIHKHNTYIHNQLTPLNIWTIIHNLGKYPSVAIVDSANSAVWGDVSYISSNELQVIFSASFSGKAYLN